MKKFKHIFRFKRYTILFLMSVFLITGCTKEEPLVNSTVKKAEDTDTHIYEYEANPSSLEKCTKQNSIPEGYTGIYTIEDLNNVNNGLDKNYILMNDLTFSNDNFTEGGAFQGGWKAINNFFGTFDGNGHVIHNLTLSPGESVGLFICFVDTDYSDGISTSTIKNLGLDDVTVNATINSANVCGSVIGTISSNGGYITGCYAENVKINVIINDFDSESQPSVLVGGICGHARMIDSCYADVSINIVDNTVYEETSAANEFENKCRIYAGGIAAFSNTAVACYYKGSISYNNKLDVFTGVLGYNTLIPPFMTNNLFNAIVKIIQDYSELERDTRIFGAYFVYKEISDSEKCMLLSNIKSAIKYYTLDPNTTLKEAERIEKIILKAYTEEEFRELNIANGIKSGTIACYRIEKEVSYAEESFAYFDFENTWVMKDGVPVLQIFQS